LVGEENVVWISPLNPDNVDYNDGLGRRNREPRRSDFIAAYNDPAYEYSESDTDDVIKRKGIIFNYGHGHIDRPGLVFEKVGEDEDSKFLFALTINPTDDDKNKQIDLSLETHKRINEENRNNVNHVRLPEEQSEEERRARSIEGIFGDRLVRIAYNKITSKNYVCYQTKFQKQRGYYKDLWERKLPNAGFYFEGQAPEKEMLPLFLNDLVETINHICLNTIANRYEYKHGAEDKGYIILREFRDGSSYIDPVRGPFYKPCPQHEEGQ
jgi:hypothetical protein